MPLRTSSLGVGTTMALGLLTLMCGQRPGTRLKVSPMEKAAAGTASGSAAASGRGATGTGSSTGGSTNDRAGGSGEPGMGEGGDAAAEPGEGSRGSGMGATDGNGGSGTGATDGNGGAAGADPTGSAAVTGDAGAAGDLGSSSGGSAAGGTVGQGALGGAAASAGTSAGGIAGADGSCGTKTSCCSADDPPCVDGCPSNASYCCNLSAGARIQCTPSGEFGSVVCINPCTQNSYGTAPCSTSCLQASDPPCSDPSWDDACLTGGFAACSDVAVGYRAACNPGDGALYYGYVSCTCDPDS
jgi:hypothetical protein